MATRLPGEIALLVRSLEQAFDQKGWHGTTLLGALRGLKPAEAQWKPYPKRHCVWELILHTAYWKYAVRRRITGGAHASFPRTPANWPALPAQPTAAALKADIALLKEEHGRLVEAVRALPVRRLQARSAKKEWTYGEMIAGVAGHDLYHTGQIQLLKRLYRKA